MTMNQWINCFFEGTKQPNVIANANSIYEQSVDDFDSHLQNLKSNILPASSIDKREFEDIIWENKIEPKTEAFLLKQISKTLDIMASTPSGKNILSRIYKQTRFGTAPITLSGGYFNRNRPIIFVKSSLNILKSPHLLLKILTHECTHAQNREMSEKTCTFALPPRLLFMHQIMNELSAYLNEQIVVNQLTNTKKPSELGSEHQLFELLDKLKDNKYIKDFSARLIKWHGNKILETEKKSFSEQELTPFAYYFKVYPILKSPHLITKLNQLYNNHVIKPLQQQKRKLDKENSR